MVLGLLFSLKGISLASMLVMVAVNPQNAQKISFCHFCFNLSMALVSFLSPPQFMTSLIEASLPYKGSLMGVLFFTFFKNVPQPLLNAYGWLVFLICPLYGIFEALQFTNLVFLMSRKLQERIDENKTYLKQLAPLTILALSLGSLSLIAYTT